MWKFEFKLLQFPILKTFCILTETFNRSFQYSISGCESLNSNFCNFPYWNHRYCQILTEALNRSFLYNISGCESLNSNFATSYIGNNMYCQSLNSKFGNVNYLNYIVLYQHSVRQTKAPKEIFNIVVYCRKLILDSHNYTEGREYLNSNFCMLYQQNFKLYSTNMSHEYCTVQSKLKALKRKRCDIITGKVCFTSYWKYIMVLSNSIVYINANVSACYVKP